MSETPDDFDQRQLEHYRKTIGPGPGADSFEVPPGLTIETSVEAFRFRGDATAILGLEPEFSKLARSEPGTEIRVEDWVLRIDDDVPARVEPQKIVLPWHAWWMAGHLFTDVAYGRYGDEPFDFSEVGYIGLIGDDDSHIPWPQPDIGVILDGPHL